MESLERYCRTLPKIELHAHLNGSLSAKTLLELGCKSDNVSHYQRLSTILERDGRTLSECFELFKIAHDITSDTATVYKACESVIEEFMLENVTYLELRTTPRSERNMTKEDYVEAVVKAIKEAPEGIIVKLLLSIDRRHDDKTSEEAMELIIRMFRKYPDVIVGVDLSGDPSKGSFKAALFKKARAAGLKISLHCGEVPNVDEIKAMLNFRPDRIGHATCLHPDHGGNVELWKLYQDNPIPAEFCLTSNVMCGTSKGYDKHHIKEWMDTNLPFCLCTDDKGVFNTTLSNEYNIVSSYYGLGADELANLASNATNFTFGMCEMAEELKIIQRNIENYA